MKLTLAKTDYFVCVDMQRLFLEPGDWYCPQGLAILPNNLALATAGGDRCVFTRFVTPVCANDAQGQWRPYYEHWQSVTQSQAGTEMMDLHSDLLPLQTEANVFDKPTYDAFKSGPFAGLIQASKARTLVISGIETDVCVLGTVLSAVDLGYKVIVVTDAVASSDTPSHEACLERVYPRFDQQIQLATTEQVLAAWENA